MQLVVMPADSSSVRSIRILLEETHIPVLHRPPPVDPCPTSPMPTPTSSILRLLEEPLVQVRMVHRLSHALANRMHSVDIAPVVTNDPAAGGPTSESFSGTATGGDGGGFGPGGNSYSGAAGPSNGGFVFNEGDDITNTNSSTHSPLPYSAYTLMQTLQTLPPMEVSLTVDPRLAEMLEALWITSLSVAPSIEELETIRQAVVTQSPETLALSMVVMSLTMPGPRTISLILPEVSAAGDLVLVETNVNSRRRCW